MKKKNRLKVEEEMRCHIQTWQESKRSQKEYCIENNLPYHKFIYWIKKVRGKQDPIGEGFIPVEMHQEVHISDTGLEITYPNGVRLRVPSDDIEFIGRLIRLV